MPCSFRCTDLNSAHPLDLTDLRNLQPQHSPQHHQQFTLKEKQHALTNLPSATLSQSSPNKVTVFIVIFDDYKSFPDLFRKMAENSHFPVGKVSKKYRLLYMHLFSLPQRIVTPISEVLLELAKFCGTTLSEDASLVNGIDCWYLLVLSLVLQSLS